ncbi:hypothetical protein QYE76_008638 [Lolium multiflorum]|uniref:Ribonuclease H1 N-terminal domain-containing protein n=1 Tax=Lolium multiflorum TaxID=4521 RepID=A0AAD8TQH0_LOLMU|nr:hypothetical protein QYE76_008638 [Lolium multiflorum]
MQLWGLDMQAKNIGNHNHGSRGYYRKRPKWRKEDALTKQAGKTIPWDEYKDQQTREFIKSREHCILIVLYPQDSHAVFLDSSSTTDPRKNYTKLKKVLDSGLCCFALKGGIVKKPIRKSEMKKWYVMYECRVPGVYDEQEDCLKQVNMFKGNNYKGYKSKKEVEARYMKHLLAEERKKNRMKSFIIVPMLLIVIVFLLYVIVV